MYTQLINMGSSHSLLIIRSTLIKPPLSTVFCPLLPYRHNRIQSELVDSTFRCIPLFLCYRFGVGLPVVRLKGGVICLDVGQVSHVHYRSAVKQFLLLPLWLLQRSLNLYKFWKIPLSHFSLWTELTYKKNLNFSTGSS